MNSLSWALHPAIPLDFTINATPDPPLDFTIKDHTPDSPLEGANMASGMAVFTNVLEGSA